MGLLNHYFRSTELLAKQAEKDDEEIIKHWKHYQSTVPRKTALINGLRSRMDPAFAGSLQELRKLLELELVDISDEEKESAEIISDLDGIEHAKRMKRVQRLKQMLHYVDTKYEYVHGLINHLYSILKTEMHLVLGLQNWEKNPDKLIHHLKSQLELELEVLRQVGKIETFHSLFLALVKGEHIIKTMDATEKRLLEKMKTGMGKIFSNDVSKTKRKNITKTWALAVYNVVHDAVETYETTIANGLDPDGSADFEFVNRPEFEQLAREAIQAYRPKKVSEEMINVFIHLFREWYNYEREEKSVDD